MGIWESNWTLRRAAGPSQLIFPAGGWKGEAPRWAGFLAGPQGCSETRGFPPTAQTLQGKLSRNTLQPVRLRTKQQSLWHLYLPPEQTRGIASGRLVCLGCLQCSNLRSTLCCCRTVYSPFRKHFRSVRNSHFSPSKTGSTALSPWDWEVK